jgi:hypothetical protein
MGDGPNGFVVAQSNDETPVPCLKHAALGLHKRYRVFAAQSKNKNQIVTALGRELLGFIWAIAFEAEKQHKVAKAA